MSWTSIAYGRARPVVSATPGARGPYHLSRKTVLRTETGDLLKGVELWRELWRGLLPARQRQGLRRGLWRGLWRGLLLSFFLMRHLLLLWLRL